MLNSETVLDRTGIDELALKPREVDLRALPTLPVDRITLDYEGESAWPQTATLRRLADRYSLRVTVPVRADGFDPLGDDSRWGSIPAGADVVLVAGNPAYLSEKASGRSIAPRLAAGLDRRPEAWVGTEGIEPLAIATGATQFELLGPRTEARIRGLRSVGFDGTIALYAPTVLSRDEDEILDALGRYVARRQPVAETLPSGTSPTAAAAGRARDVLVDACRDYGFVGDLETVRRRIGGLQETGVDHVVSYPPRGIEAYQEELAASSA